MYLSIGANALEFMQYLVKTGHMQGDPSEGHLGEMERIRSSAVQQDEEAYLAHLQTKLGEHVRVEYVPREDVDPNRLGMDMSGDDVVIAPGILSEMAIDESVAIFYESRIRHCFDLVPFEKKRCERDGLLCEACGVVLHEDGAVSFICKSEPAREAENEADEPQPCKYYTAPLQADEEIRAFTEQKMEMQQESQHINPSYVQFRFAQAANPTSFMPELGEQSIVSV